MSRSGIKGVVPLDKMASEIAKTLSDWSQDIADAMKAAVVEASAEAVRDLKHNSPRRPPPVGGAYARDWTRSPLERSRYGLKYVVHNKHHYRLTHLLEDGHANARGGGRTPAHPHIGLAEARAQDYLEEKARQYINDVD